MEHHEAILNTFEDKKEIMQKAKTGSFSGTISIKDLEPIRFAAQNGKSYLETIKGLEGPVKERISSRLYSVETEIFEKIGI